MLRDERVNNVVLNILRESLPDDRRWNVTTAESRDARKFLIFPNQGIGLAGNLFSRDFNLDFPLRVAGRFSGAHISECKDIERLTSNRSGVPLVTWGDGVRT